MSRPLPRWYRHRCDHDLVTVRDGLGGILREYCARCGARWKP